jgi:predicted nucleotidyltransferase component of viral defense system
VTTKNIAASVSNKLLKISKTSGRGFNEILVYYGMERFLARLSHSKFKSQFVLKGALALHVLKSDLARATRDIDFLAFESNDPIEMKKIIQKICEIQMEDGIIFDLKSIKSEIIKEDADYPGVRISLNAKLDAAKIPLQLDIAVGDLMTPEPEVSKFPVLIEGNEFKLKTYPKETVVAEKIQAMVALDMANSRMKDFYDVWFLATHFSFEGPLLQKALETTFKNRKTEMVQLPTALTPTFFQSKQKEIQWKAFRGRIGSQSPEDFGDVCNIIFNFVGPIMETSAGNNKFIKSWVNGVWI